MHRQCLTIAALVFTGLGISAAEVHAGIPIVWGEGEQMTNLGELPEAAAKLVARELGHSVSVAFLYRRVHVFYLDLWTWSGRHVLRSGDKYFEPDEQAWRNLIGDTPTAKYGKPFFYRFPPVPSAIVFFGLLAFTRKKFFKTEKEKFESVMNDARYQKALDVIFADGDEEGPVITTLDEGKFLSAKNGLIGEGIPNEQAEANLRKLVDAVLEQTNATIDAHLQAAADLEREGEWDNSATIFSQMISILPESDERKGYARNCLDAVEKKRSDAAQRED